MMKLMLLFLFVGLLSAHAVNVPTFLTAEDFVDAHIVISDLPGMSYTPPVISSETANGDGTTTIFFEVGLFNLSGMYATRMWLDFTSDFLDQEGVDDEIVAVAKTVPDGELVDAYGSVVCDAANLATVRAGLLDGSAFGILCTRTSGIEYWNPFDAVGGEASLSSNTDLGNGKAMLDFELADITNNSTNEYLYFSIGLKIDVLPDYEHAGSHRVVFHDMAANSTRGPSGSFSLIVDQADVTQTVNAMTSGDALKIFAAEPAGFEGDTVVLDNETIDAFLVVGATSPDLGTISQLVFTATTPQLDRLRVGNIITSDTDYENFCTASGIGLDDIFYNRLEIDDAPHAFMVESVETNGVEVTVRGTNGLVTALLGLLYEVPPVSVFSDDFATPVPTPVFGPLHTEQPSSTALNAGWKLPYEGGLRSDEIDDYLAEIESTGEDPDAQITQYIEGFKSKTYPINDWEVGPFTISGNILWSSSDIKLDAIFKGLKPYYIGATMKTTIYADLIVESRGGADNRDDPDLDKQITIIPHTNFLRLEYNVGPGNIVILPYLELDAGVTANFPGEGTFPVQTSVTFGGEFAWREGEIIFDTTEEFVEPEISETELQAALQAYVDMWLRGTVGMDLTTTYDDFVVEGSFDISGQVNVNSQLDPLGDPWFEMEGLLSFDGGIDATLLGFNIDIAHGPIGNTIEMFRVESPGPLISLRPGAGGNKSGEEDFVDPARPDIGAEWRWARLLEHKQTEAADRIPSHYQIEALAGGHSICFMGDASGLPSGRVVRLDEFGEVVWERGFGLTKVVDMAVLPSGHTTLLAEFARETILVHLDPDGNELWQVPIEVTVENAISAPYHKKVLATEEAGATVYYVLGDFFNAGMMLMKFDAAGNALWGKRYDFVDSDTELWGGHIAPDGDLLLVGDQATQAFLARVSPEGEMRWSRQLYTQWQGWFTDVCTDPDGNIYAVGGYQGIVTSEHVGNTLAKFDRDGRLALRVILMTDPDASGVPPHVTDNFAKARSCFFHDNSLFVAGDTWLGSDSGVWLARFNQDMGPMFFSLFDAPEHRDYLPDIAKGEHGILLSFATGSTRPWGNPDEFFTDNLVVNVPWEGHCRIHEATGIQTSFLKPVMFNTFAYDNALVTSLFDSGEFLKTENGITDEIFDLELETVTELAWTPGIRALDWYEEVPLLTRNLRDTAFEDGYDGYGEWEADQALNEEESGAESDPDGDGRSNGIEAIAGSDPLEADEEPVLYFGRGEPGEPVELTVEIDDNAEDLGAAIECSSNLIDWVRYPIREVTLVDNGEGNRKTVLIDPSIQREFFRVTMIEEDEPPPSTNTTDDTDGDGFDDVDDNCPFEPNADQADGDNDGIGDLCDDDFDNDGVPNLEDLCPFTPNPDQADADGDNIGDACDPDDDNDGEPDLTDLCPLVPNPNQVDTDEDGLGDLCDDDKDNDGFPNAVDNCPCTANPDQANNDGDSEGDVCDADDDNDLIADADDLCPFTAGPNTDADGDGIGDVCDDGDNDGIFDIHDNCPLVFNPTQLDVNFNGIGDACENSGCDPCDQDNDGILDPFDNCLTVSNSFQYDTDDDGLGDVCDDDKDNDGVHDAIDNCPLQPNPDQIDADLDGAGDACDCEPQEPKEQQDDEDEDGVPDECDNCPDDYNPNQEDGDENGEGDACDPLS